MLAVSAVDKRSAILHATMQLLASRGFHGFSVKQLAEKAGVATGTVYLYFKDRDDLIRQLHSEMVQELSQHLFVGMDEDLPHFEQYRRMCLNFWQFCQEHPEVPLCKAQFDHLPTDVLRVQLDVTRQMFKPMYRLFDCGRKQGVVKNIPNDVLGSLAVGPILSLANNQYLGLIEVDERCLESFIEACWDAIACNK